MIRCPLRVLTLLAMLACGCEPKSPPPVEGAPQTLSDMGGLLRAEHQAVDDELNAVRQKARGVDAGTPDAE